MTSSNQATELGDLLSGVVRGIVAAQTELDDHARRQQEQLVQTPLGEMGLPPLWFTFKDVEIDITLSATLETTGTARSPVTHLVCRTVDPAHVSLYGYDASASLRVRARIGPQGFATLHDHAADVPAPADAPTPSEPPK